MLGFITPVWGRSGQQGGAVNGILILAFWGFIFKCIRTIGQYVWGSVEGEEARRWRSLLAVSEPQLRGSGCMWSLGRKSPAWLSPLGTRRGSPLFGPYDDGLVEESLVWPQPGCSNLVFPSQCHGVSTHPFLEAKGQRRFSLWEEACDMIATGRGEHGGADTRN